MADSSVTRIKQTTQHGLCASLLIAALALGISGQVQASPLNLTKDTPDIFSSGMNISYVAGTGMFSATGFATSQDDGGINPSLPIGNMGNFSLTASIDNCRNNNISTVQK